MIRVTTKREGFRRAGVAHYGTREYPDGFFSGAALAALKAEPLLVVEAGETAPAAEAAASEGDSPSGGKGKKA